MLESLVDRCRRRDRLALARLLTLVSRGEHLQEILGQVEAAQKACKVVAFTGSGGVGKSTLLGKSIEFLRRQGKTVAVLACDPQSPLSGGALLGDRFRMPSAPDDGVFIRSLATPSGSGTVARHLHVMLRVLDAYGFDLILIETVGAGQGDTAVRDLADAVVLLLQPETGDELQWEKAGLLEVADVVVIHKADLPGAERAEAQVRSSLGEAIPIVRVSSRSETGIVDLWKVIDGIPKRLRAGSADGQELLRRAQDLLATRFSDAATEPGLKSLLAEWQHSGTDNRQAAALLHYLAGRDRTNKNSG